MYCDKAALVAEFGEAKITAWSQQDDRRIESACTAASSIVDGYVSGGGYATPIEQPPHLIRSLAVDIAVYRLLTSKGHLGADRDPGAEALSHRSSAVVKYLADVRAGKLRIEGLARSTPAGTGGARGNVQVSAPLTPIDMRGYLR